MTYSKPISLGHYRFWEARLLRWFLRKKNSQCIIVFRYRKPKPGYHYGYGGGLRKEHATRVQIYLRNIKEESKSYELPKSVEQNQVDRIHKILTDN